jgi:hypothetical protein
VMAPELKGSSFVDLAKSIRWVRSILLELVEPEVLCTTRLSKPALQVRTQGCMMTICRCLLPLLACRDKTPQVRRKVVLGHDAPEGASLLQAPAGSACRQ